MRKVVFASVAAVLFIVSVVTAGGEATAPVYNPGESWTYSTKEWRSEDMASSMSGFRDEAYAVNITADGLEIDSIFAEIFPSVDEGPKTISGIEWFRFPLKVGNSWDVKYLNRRGRWRDGTVKVLAVEKVTVTAGAFTAYKLIMEEDTGMKNDIEYWYAPTVKSVVRAVQKRYRRESLKVKREAELSSYKLKPSQASTK